MKKFLFDLFPIFLFYLTFKLAGIFPEQAAALAASVNYTADQELLPILMATAVTIVAVFMQVIWSWFRHRKVDTMLWVALGLIVVFGGATLVLRDKLFIQWKLTIFYWLFAAVLAGGHFLFKKNLIRTMMKQAQLELPEIIWARLNYSWIVFLTALGGANLYVAYNFSNAVWVDFKMFGVMGLMFAFLLLQGWVLMKYMEKETD